MRRINRREKTNTIFKHTRQNLLNALLIVVKRWVHVVEVSDDGRESSEVLKDILPIQAASTGHRQRKWVRAIQSIVPQYLQ